MIVVRLQGGLGNQMFQYAFGYSWSQSLGEPLALDLRWFSSPVAGRTERPYELHRYTIMAAVPEPGRLPGYPVRRRHRFLQKLGLSAWKVYESPVPGFDPMVPRWKNALYVGYWQSEDYFAPYADILRRQLMPRAEPGRNNPEYLSRIRDSMAVSLHVRRGDYAQVATTQKTHGLTPLEYYRRAILMLRERLSDPRFFVFSDDLPWCREQLPLDEHNSDYVEGNPGEAAYEDLRLMSQCRHHIIANSSFSWWGAWLNPSPDKIVIAPRRWFADPTMEDRGIIPRTWIKL